MGEEGRVVAAVHEPEHLVASALQRYVEMRHEGTAGGTVVDERIIYEVRLQTADAEPVYPLHPIELPHEVEERLTRLFAEITDVDSGDHDFTSALFGRFLCQRHERLDGRTAAESAGIGNGAVSAEIVAPVLHLEEEAGTVAPGATVCEGSDFLGLHGVEAVQVGRFGHSAPCLGEMLHQTGLLIGPQHEVDTLDAANSLRRQLRIASRHHDEGPGVIAYHAVNGLPALMVGHFRHRTGIDKAEVGLFAFPGLRHAHISEHAGKGRCLREIELASQGEIGSLFALKSR